MNLRLTLALSAIALTLVGCDMPPKKDHIVEPVALRVATFNVSMDASNYLDQTQLQQHGAHALAQALADQHPQIQAIAEIIQHVRPDILVLNEFDYLPEEQGIKVFLRDYLQHSQRGESPIDYPYVYVAPVNTGIPSPFDLNGDGVAGGVGNDAWGFGWYPGQYGMVVLSKYPIENEQVRTFQHFKWKDMPGALADRKSTRLNSSHVRISYAVFCLKKKKDTRIHEQYH